MNDGIEIYSKLPDHKKVILVSYNRNDADGFVKYFIGDKVFTELENKKMLDKVRNEDYFLFFLNRFEHFATNTPLLLCNLNIFEQRLTKYGIPHEKVWFFSHSMANQEDFRLRFNSKLNIGTFHTPGCHPDQALQDGNYHQGETEAIIIDNFREKVRANFVKNINTRRERHFLALNSKTQYPHRIYLVLLFYKFGLLEKSFFTFGPNENVLNDILDESKRKHPLVSFLCEKYQISSKDTHELKSNFDKLIWKDVIVPHGDFLSKAFYNTFFTPKSFVTDSYFYIENFCKYNRDSGHPGFVTCWDKNQDLECECDECKKLYPMPPPNWSGIHNRVVKLASMYHPFIIFGPPNVLHFLRGVGFKTFDKWVDESYDEIEDDKQRLFQVSEEILKIGKMSINDLHEMYVDMREVLEYNFNYYYDEFLPQTLEFDIKYNQEPYFILHTDELYAKEFGLE